MENSGLSLKEKMKVQRGEACHPGLQSCKGLLLTTSQMFTVAPLGPIPCPVLNGSSAENTPTFILSPPPGTPASRHCSPTAPPLSCLCTVERFQVQAVLDLVPSGLGRTSLRRYSAAQTRTSKDKQRLRPHMLSGSLRPGWSFRVILSKLGGTFAKSAETPTSKLE